MDKILKRKNFLLKNYLIKFTSKIAHGEERKVRKLIETIDRGNIKEVEKLLKTKDYTDKNLDLINSELDDDGITPLCVACSKGDAGMIRLLVQEGAQVGLPSFGGWTPIHYAAAFGHVEAIQELYRLGADLNQPMADTNETPAQIAIINNRKEAEQVLYRLGSKRKATISEVGDSASMSMGSSATLAERMSLAQSELSASTIGIDDDVVAPLDRKEMVVAPLTREEMRLYLQRVKHSKATEKTQPTRRSERLLAKKSLSQSGC